MSYLNYRSIYFVNILRKCIVKFYFSIGSESNLPYPKWPQDFRWSYHGGINGYRCVRIIEPSDPHTWRDNYFCSSRQKKDPGMRWSYRGPIRGMKCTRIREPSDPNTWGDNYLCLPRYSPLNLQWSYRGRIRGKACIRWIEPSDPHTWRDNYLCGKFQFIWWFIFKNTRSKYVQVYSFLQCF